MKGFLDSMSKREEENCHNLLARAIYASGTPLSITENVHWQKFLTTLRPSYTPPSRSQLSYSLLDKSYEDMKLDVRKKIDNSTTVGLQCDGWSNLRNEGIINFIISTPEPVLFKTLCTEGNKQTGQYIADEISNVIEDIGYKKVLGICTDNCSAMKRGWQILQEKYDGKQILIYGCVDHILNLLVKDVVTVTSIDTVLKSGTSVVKEVKASHLLTSLFTKIQKQDTKKVTITLKLPGKTRWGSQISCLNSLLINKHNLQALAISPEDNPAKQATKTLLLDEEFWIGVKIVVSLLEPILYWITSLESDVSKISQVPETFYELRQHFSSKLRGNELKLLNEEEVTAVFNALEKRASMALQPIHFAANILDPSFKGKNLNKDDYTKGCTLIVNLTERFGLDRETVLREFAEYAADTGVWKEDYVQKSISVVRADIWWKGICKSSSLCKIGSEILNLPPTSAATERSFSTYGWIQNAKRNRLTIQRAGKITYISHNMRFFESPKNRPKECSNQRSVSSKEVNVVVENENDDNGSYVSQSSDSLAEEIEENIE